MTIHGGHLVAKTLKKAGVECIFTLCGGHIMPIYDGCLREEIRIVDFRHEQAAAHAADAWSRLKPGSIGVAVVTAGPGVTDAVTGVANAWRAASPMLLLGGQGPFKNRGRGSLQEMNHVDLLKPITKWADVCYQTERIPEYIERAVRHAFAGNPGPSFLELPMDILMNTVSEEIPIPPINPRPLSTIPDSKDLRAVLEILETAERPVLMIGTGARWSSAGPSLSRFLARTHLPTFANGMGRGVLPYDSEHLFQMTRRKALKECDVLLLAGAVLDFRLAFGESIPKDTKILQFSLDMSEIGKNRSADIELVGDIGKSFDKMIEIMEEEGVKIDFSSYQTVLRDEEAQLCDQSRTDSQTDQVPIPVQRFCQEIAEFVDDEMILVGDGGDVVATSSKMVPVPKNGFWLDPGPLGTLGVGMPFAIAAKLAYPDKRVLIIYGDGSFGLNGFEYDTAVRFGLPIVGIVGNDGAWGQMMRPQCAFFGKDRLVATLLERTRYDKVVEALGGYGELVTRPDQIRPALERAFAFGKPACVNVEIERDYNFKGGIYV